ncbi:hypothetical protein SEA_JACOREN57_65 [Mycobacterium phage JacoRen57]|nr:hypothetical protein SEA_JACOREN57_65 [Mycobacterium phage JacoRen57]
MTARRTRKAPASIDVAVEDLEPNTDVIVEDAPVVDDDPDPAPARKYMSHANCDHPRKGEAGKAARAQCRRAHRAWFAAEAEWLASHNNDSVAV